MISLPQTSHFTSEVTGETRAQNPALEPCIATTETGGLINSGRSIGIMASTSLMITSDDVTQQPNSDAITQV